MILQSGEYSLGTDVGPCAPGVDGIDITASNVTLHLNGHTIIGAATDCNTSNGIHLMGTSFLLPLSLVRVLGSGTISNFFIGFRAENSAGSFVKFVTVTANCSFYSYGFAILPSSGQWKLDGNIVREPGATSTGILLQSVDDNDLVRNDVNDGIALFSSSNTVVNNTANDNQGNAIGRGGIFVSNGSTNNDIDANTTDNNSPNNGITLQLGATGNNISGNNSFNNFTFDMKDDNASCDNNTWTGNHFNTANQSCIH
jgi:parallel beta-helix repeat protein